MQIDLPIVFCKVIKKGGISTWFSEKPSRSAHRLKPLVWVLLCANSCVLLGLQRVVIAFAMCGSPVYNYQRIYFLSMATPFTTYALSVYNLRSLRLQPIVSLFMYFCWLFGDRHTMCITAAIHIVRRPSYNLYYGRHTVTLSPKSHFQNVKNTSSNHLNALGASTSKLLPK